MAANVITEPDHDLDADLHVDVAIDAGVAARLFHGLSDATRLSILLTLLEGERRVSDIVAAVGSSQSNVSNHLACLKGCGLVVDRPGARRQVFYSIARPEVRDLLVASERLLLQAGDQVEHCDNPQMLPTPGDRS